MTAAQIRKTKFEHDDGAWESARWLQEIAAQLAESNARNARLEALILRQEKKIQKRKLIRVHPVRSFKRRRP
jgi:hypothetical protein